MTPRLTPPRKTGSPGGGPGDSPSVGTGESPSESATHTTDEAAWFEPSGRAQGERNAHRLRGWSIAIASALLLWGAIVVIVWGVTSLG